MKISEDTIKQFETDFKECINEPRIGKFKRKQADSWMEGWLKAKGIWRKFEVAINSHRFIEIINKYYK